MKNELRFPSLVAIGLLLTANTLCLAWPFDLELTKEVDKLEAFEGETVVFTIVVDNHGLGDPSSVIVEDVFPAGLSFQGFNASQGTYVSATGLWDVGTLHSLDPPASLQISAIVETGTAGQTIWNTASIITPVDDMDPNNNMESAYVTVIPEPATLGLLILGGLALIRRIRVG